jgi:hypothetical protein
MPLPLGMKLPGSIRSVRPTWRERTCALPGDSLIAHPIQSLTYAITIACPPQEVWPWLAQMGSGRRAGWYSYDRIDNAGRHSAESILCSLQDVAVGTTFPVLPGIDDGLTVVQFEREASLVLAWRPQRDSAPIITWTFVLEARRWSQTRLIVRARATCAAPSQTVPFWAARPIVHFGHFLMQRKQLLGIAERAERVGSPGSRPVQRDAA